MKYNYHLQLNEYDKLIAEQTGIAFGWLKEPVEVSGVRMTVLTYGCCKCGYIGNCMNTEQSNRGRRDTESAALNMLKMSAESNKCQHFETFLEIKGLTSKGADKMDAIERSKAKQETQRKKALRKKGRAAKKKWPANNYSNNTRRIIKCIQDSKGLTAKELTDKPPKGISPLAAKIVLSQLVRKGKVQIGEGLKLTYVKGAN